MERKISIFDLDWIAGEVREAVNQIGHVKVLVILNLILTILHILAPFAAR
jgi:hypothetical protein